MVGRNEKVFAGYARRSGYRLPVVCFVPTHSPNLRSVWAGGSVSVHSPQSTIYRLPALSCDVRWTVRTLVHTPTTPDRTLSTTHTFDQYTEQGGGLSCLHAPHTVSHAPPSINDGLSSPWPSPSHLTDVILDSQPRVSPQFSQKKTNGLDGDSGARVYD
jgi:hypothetical protein